uniref:Phosphatidylinositol-3-phosphatase SAC1 n=1 Tax=Cacopsylla melanoneura TaxID=428564 RepID=A0A8D9BUV5_9HEMI
MTRENEGLLGPYNAYYLYMVPEKFCVVPVNDFSKILIIDRLSGAIKVEHSYSERDLPNPQCRRLIYGILGLVNLLAGAYILFITERKKIGTVSGQDIYQIVQTEMFPCCPTKEKIMTNHQASLNQQYISMIKKILSTPYFYYSYTYDLTYNMQRLYNVQHDFLLKPLHERADERFIWNRNLLDQFYTLESPDVGAFCVPVIHGFISINKCIINGKTFLWTLISRRSCKRAGTRLFTRGVDSDGNVANFVETEQIIEFEGYQSSFVQIRGSIPLFWQQYPNLKLKPSPKIIQENNNMEAVNKHFKSQEPYYGYQVILNLIDQCGDEGDIEKAYRNSIRLLNSERVQYEAFDFHKECRKMRWDRLQILIDRVAQTQDAFSTFLLLQKSKLLSSQEGVFRTNCIDCLDRTNVVQSMLAKRSLGIILKKLGIWEVGEIDNTFEYLFKQVWADNADIISIQYSGTGALKTDFTRTGKRTKAGMLNDLYNSLARYYKNNFQDGFRQDALDLFLGNYKVSSFEKSDSESPLVVQRGWKFFMFPSLLVISMAMFFCNVIIPPEYTTKSLLSILFWGSMIFITFTVTLRDGPLFVDKPRLYNKAIVDSHYQKNVV